MILRSGWDVLGLFLFFAIFAALSFALIDGSEALGLPPHPRLDFAAAAIVAMIPSYYVSFTIPERRKRERQAHARAEALAVAGTPLRNEAKLPDGGRTDFDPHLVHQSGAMAYAMDPGRRLLRVVYGSERGTADILMPLDMVSAISAHPNDPSPRLGRRLSRKDGPTLVLTGSENGRKQDFKLRFAPDEAELAETWHDALRRAIADNEIGDERGKVD